MLDAEERADAEHRVANLTHHTRKLVDLLAERGDHTLVLEGQKAYTKSWQDLENNGWIRSTANGFTGSDQVTTVQFTMDGWLALDILYPDEAA